MPSLRRGDAPVPLRTGDIAALRRALLEWYRRAARDLPWRRDNDPYRVWVSEIMLQQTRVAGMRAYYQRFLTRFPTVDALARAEQPLVLKLWAGLGYYARARNLHRAARQIVAERGAFPGSAVDWERLPGVGRYTAAAIASITRGERVAVLDGNVKRVLARLLAIEERIDDRATTARLWGQAQRLLAPRAPGDFNQALMELGATVCGPRAARCTICPLRPFCAAARLGRQAELPRRAPRRAARRVFADAALVVAGGRALCVPRSADARLLAGFWTLPGCELAPRATRASAAAGRNLAAHLRKTCRLAVGPLREIGCVRHVFTHLDLLVRVYACAPTARAARPSAPARWINPQRPAVPLSALDRKLVRFALDGERNERGAPP